MPTGEELKKKIKHLVDLRLEDVGPHTIIHGDQEIREALMKHLKSQGDLKSYIEAAQHIRDSMDLAESIDDFIDDHDGNERIELIGKLAIVRAILQAEGDSLLAISNDPEGPLLDFGKLQKTWFIPFEKILKNGYKKGDQTRIFDHVSFIVFNYDRCVEHFLYHFLHTYYDIPVSEVADIMSTLEIHHPYGVVGRLPMFRGDKGTSFGEECGRVDLLSLASQIRTYKEHIGDQDAKERLGKLVHEAKYIIFLGFAYHKQNLQLMKPPPYTHQKLVRGTAKHMSDENRNEARGRVFQALRTGQVNLNIDLHTELTCYELIRNFSLSFSQ